MEEGRCLAGRNWCSLECIIREELGLIGEEQTLTEKELGSVEGDLALSN